jgi:glucokinase
VSTSAARPPRSCCAPDLDGLARAEVPTPAAEGGTAMVGAALGCGPAPRQDTGPASRCRGRRGGHRRRAPARARRQRLLPRLGRLRGDGDHPEARSGSRLTSTTTSTRSCAARRPGRRRGRPARPRYDPRHRGRRGAVDGRGAVRGSARRGRGDRAHPRLRRPPCTCGGHGHLETLASGRSIGRRYGERTGRDRSRAKAVAAAADAAATRTRRRVRGRRDAVARAILITAGLMDVTDRRDRRRRQPAPGISWNRRPPPSPPSPRQRTTRRRRTGPARQRRRGRRGGLPRPYGIPGTSPSVPAPLRGRQLGAFQEWLTASHPT